MHINTMVQNNNLTDLRQRQKQFQKVKTDEVRAKSIFDNMNAMNVENLKGSYENRVFQRMEVAKQTEAYTKQLELEEA